MSHSRDANMSNENTSMNDTWVDCSAADNDWNKPLYQPDVQLL